MHRVGRGAGPAVAAGQGPGLGHRRVLDAAGLDLGAQRPRGGAGQAVGPHAGDPAPDRALAAGGHRPRARWARCRSPSTATCSRPTAAPAPRRSAAATSRCTTRARGSSPTKKMGAHPLTDQCAAISVGIVDALPYLDLDYSEDVRAEVDMNVVMTGAGRFVEVQGTAEGAAVLAERARRPARAGRGRHRRDLRRSSARCWPSRPAPPATPTVKFVLATANPDKAREIARRAPRRRRRRRARAPAQPTCPRSTRPATTLEDNARLKAVALCEATGLPAIADDTGLEVDALGGAPGVHSARFAGDDATYADNVREAARRCSTTCPTPSTAPPASPPWRSPAGPTAGRSRRSATSRA